MKSIHKLVKKSLFILFVISNSYVLASTLFVDTRESLQFRPSTAPQDVVRERYASLNQSALLTGSSTTKTIHLNLFTDRTLISQLHSAEYTGKILRWRGTIEGDPTSYVVLLMDGKDLSGRIYAFRKEYEVFATGNGIHQIRELRALLSPFDPSPVIPLNLKSRVLTASAKNNTPVVQVLIVYSSKAAAKTVGSTMAFSLKAIDESNMILLNSKAKVVLDLAGFVILDYDEAGQVFKDLDQLTIPNDGILDQIHNLRDSKKADIVTLVVSYQYSFGGAGHQMWDLSMDFSPFAFNVVRIFRTGFWIPTFAHEIGHNLGSSHDRCEDSAAIFKFSYAYENLDQGWATIMSNGTCLFQAGRASFAGLPIFSNDRVKYNGLPTGTAIKETSPANNATSLFYGASAARTWRQNCKGSQTPQLVLPLNSAKGVSTTKFLELKMRSWPWVEMQIATNPSLNKAKSYIAFSNKFSVPLQNNTTYYWRVKGMNDCTESSFSEVRKFTTRP